MNGKAFFDTNVVVYAIVQNDPRKLRAQELLFAGGTISAQVLNEFVSIVRRKVQMPWDDVRATLQSIRLLCPEILAVTVETHESAVRIAERYGYTIYDALIVASALEAKCGTLYSEDLKDGQIIDERMTVRNPFR
ncbi:MAG TPA: PIN domain-containing protein [Candidatus Sulfotelmatobacter sp.]|jgi:predicted nucleic acid-binding protein